MYKQKLTFRGEQFRESRERVLGRVTFHDVPQEIREDCFLGLRKGNQYLSHQLEGYAGLLVEEGAEENISEEVVIPTITKLKDLSVFDENSILAINPNGSTHILYRPESSNNTLFATARCNSNCIMCSQPPTLADDNEIVKEHLRLIDLIHEPPGSLGITGGEPTLLGKGLVLILESLKRRFPDTAIHMLTNGRLYSYENLVQELAEVRHPHFLSAIPLYSSGPLTHDYIVQGQGAFDQTIKGLYHAAKHGLDIEIRVVLHKQTVPGLVLLMEYIYRNLPFVKHVALMGLENMGYVKKNWDDLWIDPHDYEETLKEAVKYLFYRGILVSIYNLPLCIVSSSIWPFARKSISDYKNIYLDHCEQCDAKPYCSGLFSSSKERHSREIKPLRLSDSQRELLRQPMF